MKDQLRATRPAARGFTLIEILAVMTIIAILAAITIAGIGGMTKAADRKATETQLALMRTKLQEYKLDKGVFPGGEDPAPSPPADGNKDSAGVLFQKLGGMTASGAKETGAKTYIPDLAQKNKRWTDGTTVIDKFGYAIRYRVGDSATNPDYDLWSVGPDGDTDEENPDAEVNADDLRNF